MNKKLLIFVLILLTAVFLTASFVGCDENGDKEQTFVNGYISYSFMDDYGSVYEDIYDISDETLESLNGKFAQENIVFDLVGLDTSLPAEGQNVCLQGGGCDSNTVVPEMRAE